MNMTQLRHIIRAQIQMDILGILMDLMAGIEIKQIAGGDK